MHVHFLMVHGRITMQKRSSYELCFLFWSSKIILVLKTTLVMWRMVMMMETSWVRKTFYIYFDTTEYKSSNDFRTIRTFMQILATSHEGGKRPNQSSVAQTFMWAFFLYPISYYHKRFLTSCGVSWVAL